jgi:hypothetical protein
MRFRVRLIGMEFQCRVIVQRRCTSCCSSVENIPLQAERQSGSRQRLFGLPPDSVFSFRPECCSASQRNGVQLRTGIAFTFDRIPHFPATCNLRPHSSLGSCPDVTSVARSLRRSASNPEYSELQHVQRKWPMGRAHRRSSCEPCDFTRPQSTWRLSDERSRCRLASAAPLDRCATDDSCGVLPDCPNNDICL